MKNDNHIDEIFRNTFEHFEADVDPSVWTNVQQNIGSGGAGTSSASGSTGTGIAKSALLKVAASVLVTAGIAGSVYLIHNATNGTKEVLPVTDQTVSPVMEPELIQPDVLLEENQVTNTTPTEGNNPLPATEQEVVNTEDHSSSITTTSTPVNTEEVITQEATNNPVKITQTSSNPVVSAENTHSSNNNTSPTNNNITENKSAQATELSVSIVTNVKKGKAPLYVEFNTMGNAVSYLWDFGDGTISSEETPFHTFKEPGTYKVALTAIDQHANQKTITQFIEVEKNNVSTLEEVQNVFSPNGDGLNDVIKIDGKNIAKFNASIMDSKGNVIYQWSSIDGFWDGRDNNNNLLPKGTYYIAVTAIGEDGEKHTKRKSIQLY